MALDHRSDSLTIASHDYVSPERKCGDTAAAAAIATSTSTTTTTFDMCLTSQFLGVTQISDIRYL